MRKNLIDDEVMNYLSNGKYNEFWDSLFEYKKIDKDICRIRKKITKKFEQDFNFNKIIESLDLFLSGHGELKDKDISLNSLNALFSKNPLESIKKEKLKSLLKERWENIFLELSIPISSSEEARQKKYL